MSLPKIHQPFPASDVTLYGAGGKTGLVWHFATLLRLYNTGEYSPYEEKFRIGTSAGSIVSVMIDSKLSLEKLLALSLGTDVRLYWKKYNSPKTPDFNVAKKIPADPLYFLRSVSQLNRPYLRKVLFSLLPDSEHSAVDLENFVKKATGDKWPKTPTWVTVTERYSGEPAYLTKHSNVSVSKAVTASCALPGVYAPVSVNGVDYQDGGIFSSTYLGSVLPFVSSVTIFTPLLPPKDLRKIKSLTGNFLRTASYLSLKKDLNQAKELGIPVKLISPRPQEQLLLSNSHPMDPSFIAELAEVTLSPN